MANEVVISAEQVEAVTPNYNKKVGNKVLCLTIKCKRIKDEAKKLDFNSVKLLKHLPAYDIAGNNLGKKNRWIDLHFTKGAFKAVEADCEVHSAEDLMTGFLYVKAFGVQSPSTYKVTVDDDGQPVYPVAWIKDNAVVGFEPYVSSQDEFDYHDTGIDAEEVVSESTPAAAPTEQEMPWDK